METSKARIELDEEHFKPYFRLLVGENVSRSFPICRFKVGKRCCGGEFQFSAPTLVIGDGLAAESANVSEDPKNSIDFSNSDDINYKSLNIWRRLAEHYNIFVDDSVKVRKLTNLVALKKVTFCVKNERSAAKFAAYLSDCMKNGENLDDLVVTKNDFLWWKQDLMGKVVVNETYPSRSGLMTSETSVFLTVADNYDQFLKSQFKFGGKFKDLRRLSQIFNFVYKFLLLPFYLHQNRCHEKCRRIFTAKLNPFNFTGDSVILMNNIGICKCMTSSETKVDSNSTIFIDFYTAKLFSVQNNSYALIRTDKNIYRYVYFKIRRLCCRFCRFDYFKHFNVVVPKILYFNLEKPKFIKMVNFIAENSAEIRYAKEVKVATVTNPSYPDDINCDEILKLYFEIPRLCRIGEIFSVNHSSSSQENDDKHSKNKIFFKIVSLSLTENCANCEDNQDHVIYGCLIDSSRSTLIKVLNTNSRISQTLDHSQMHYRTLDRHAERINSLLTPIQADLKANFYSPFLFYGPPGSGKLTLARSIAYGNDLNFMDVDCYDLWSEVSGTSEVKIKHAFGKALKHAPLVFYLKNLDVIGKDPQSEEYDSRVVSSFAKCLREFHKLTTNINVNVNSNNADKHNGGDKEKSASPENLILVVIGSTQKLDVLPQQILSEFSYQFKTDVLAIEERQQLLADFFDRHGEQIVDRNEIDAEDLLKRTSGFVLSDMRQLFSEAKNRAIRNLASAQRLNDLYKNRFVLDSAGYVISGQDLVEAAESLHASYADSLGAPRVPDVKWSDVGGLTDVKNAIFEAIHVTLNFPDVFASGLRRSGILLYGPPGCGKTLLAKAVASQCQLNFISVKGPELLNMYVGQSEQNVRDLFEKARGCAPCVVFFDEIDALAPNRGRSSDSGGVMDRLVSQLLAEMDGIHESRDVFIIGATNRPDLLDPALLRPGRFDKCLYVGVGEDDQSRLNVLRAVTRKLKMDSNIDLLDLVKKCPKNMSGADFFSLASEASINAVSRIIEKFEKSDSNDEVDYESEENRLKNFNVVVTEDDFLKALSNLRCSISSFDAKKFSMRTK